MIIYDLKCGSEHVFEGWFRDSEEYQQQLASGLLQCPLCGSGHIAKLPASHISVNPAHTEKTDSTEIQAEASTSSVTTGVDIQQKLAAINAYAEQLRDYIEKHSEDVGTKFPEEARRIHYGEAEKRNIHGEAGLRDVLELEEEGIPTQILPFISKSKKDLN